MNLSEARVGEVVVVEAVRGERSFRRRLMELGLLPGTAVTFLGTAPLGDPLHLMVRGCQLSIRRSEATLIGVRALASIDAKAPVVPSTPVSAS